MIDWTKPVKCINDLSMNIASPRRRMQPEDRRAQLMDYGIQVFARLGIGRASHAEIAREAGVSVATVFNYFPTREILVLQILEEVAKNLTALLENLDQKNVTAPQALYNLMRAFADATETHTDMVRVWLEWSTSVRDDIWPKYLVFQEKVVNRLQDLIVRGQRQGQIPADVDPRDAARIIVGDAHMVVLMHFAHQAARDMDGFLRHLIESVLKIPATSLTA
ncbi:MAG TPA: TetR/AcrR family transcriptional regulator [Alphaproteobacteria bacterium]|jgi:TetR/AcrR family transcriptional regulator, hemagglutinin/protease regulatory protein|nr:TetR/AcrR family transcriptional regulator [Alphaproteobacteria bacterium]